MEGVSVSIKTWILVPLLVAGVSVSAQTGRQGAAAATAKPMFKAIWERVPFTKDINLEAVECVAAEECWAAGRKGNYKETQDSWGISWKIRETAFSLSD